MKSRLLDCAMPIFNTLHAMMQQTTVGTSYGPTFRHLLHQFEKEAFECQIPSHHVHDAKYALVAMIDESVLRYSPDEQWITQLLQVEMFGEHMAGEHFFKWLDRIKPATDALGVLEVYYVCLKMGFCGRYAIEGQEKLSAIHVSVKHAIDMMAGVPDPNLSSRLLLPSALSFMKQPFPWWGYGAASFGAMVIIYITYQLLISGVVA